MIRRRPPDRRPSQTVAVVWTTEAGAHRFSVTAGYDPTDGRLCEVFYADGQRAGSALQHSVQDACVLISIALQHGVPLSGFAQSLGTVPVLGSMEPASPIGAIVRALSALEAEIIRATEGG